MSNPVVAAIMERRSIRAYKNQPVPKSDLEQIAACAIHAPSARNLQPWRVAIVTNPALLAELNAVACRELAKINPDYAKEGASIHYHAPAVLFVAGKSDSPYSGVDCGHLAENACLAAQSLGLGTVIAAMWRYAFAAPEGKDFMKRLGFTEEYQFHYGISVGYPDQAPDAKPRDAGLVAWIE